MGSTTQRAIIRTLSLCLAALWLGACATSEGPPPPPVSQPYRIGPPDQLHVTILPEPLIERTVVVRPDGMISIDLVGDIPAAGRTAQEVADDIQLRISRFKRDASVTVALSESLSTEITVLGEVTRPSTFPLSRETHLIEALGQALLLDAARQHRDAQPGQVEYSRDRNIWLMKDQRPAVEDDVVSEHKLCGTRWRICNVRHDVDVAVLQHLEAASPLT